MWRVYGEQLLTAELSGAPVYYQRFQMPSDQVIAAISTRLVIFNDPVFTSAELRIYSDHLSSPGTLLFTSATRSKAAIHSLKYGIREVSFLFDPKPWIKGGDHYHAVLWLNGYTGTASSHVAWIRGFPKPVNPTGLSVTFEKIAVLPFDLGVFGSAI